MPYAGLSTEKNGASSSDGSGMGGRGGRADGGKGKRMMNTKRIRTPRPEQVMTTVRSENKQHGSPKNRAKLRDTTGWSTMSSSLAPTPLRDCLWPRMADTFGHRVGADSAEVGSGGLEGARIERRVYLGDAAPTASRAKNKTAKVQRKASQSPEQLPNVPGKAKIVPKLSVTAPNNLPESERQRDGDKQPPKTAEHMSGGNRDGVESAIAPDLSSLSKTNKVVAEKSDRTTAALGNISSKARAGSVGDQLRERRGGER